MLRLGRLPLLEFCSAAGLVDVRAAPPPARRSSDLNNMYMLSSDDDNSITSSALGDAATSFLLAICGVSGGTLFVTTAMGNGADLLGVCCAAVLGSGPCCSLSLELVDTTILRRFGVVVVLFGDSHLRISLGSCSDII